MIACGQALGDVHHGVIKVRFCGGVCFEVGVSFVSQDVIVNIFFRMFISKFRRLTPLSPTLGDWCGRCGVGVLCGCV